MYKINGMVTVPFSAFRKFAIENFTPITRSDNIKFKGAPVIDEENNEIVLTFSTDLDTVSIDPTRERVKYNLRNGSKSEAIKIFRGETGANLKDAKEYVDKIENMMQRNGEL